MNREHLFAGFFFAVFVYLLYQTVRIFSPFLQPIMWGAVLALTLSPLQARLVRVLHGRNTAAALILTVGLVVTVTVPSLLFGSVVTRQAAGLYAKTMGIVDEGGSAAVLEWLNSSSLGSLWAHLSPYVDQYNVDMTQLARNALSTTYAFLADHAGRAARNLVRVCFNLLVIVMTFFVFVRDGTRVVNQVRVLIPMERVHADAIIDTLYDTLSGVVQAMLATALLQGVLAGVGYWLAGVPFSFFLGVLSGFLSLIPYAVPLVWMGSAGYLIAQGSAGAAVFLCVWGVAVVGSVDNIVRPLIIGEKAKLSALLLFFAILGGLSVYGFLGLLLGPVIVATVLTFFRIYRTVYVAGGLTGAESGRA